MTSDRYARSAATWSIVPILVDDRLDLTRVRRDRDRRLRRQRRRVAIGDRRSARPSWARSGAVAAAVGVACDVALVDVVAAALRLCPRLLARAPTRRAADGAGRTVTQGRDQGHQRIRQQSLRVMANQRCMCTRNDPRQRGAPRRSCCPGRPLPAPRYPAPSHGPATCAETATPSVTFTADPNDATLIAVIPTS